MLPVEGEGGLTIHFEDLCRIDEEKYRYQWCGERKLACSRHR